MLCYIATDKLRADMSGGNQFPHGDAPVAQKSTVAAEAIEYSVLVPIRANKMTTAPILYLEQDNEAVKLSNLFANDVQLKPLFLIQTVILLMFCFSKDSLEKYVLFKYEEPLMVPRFVAV